MVRPKRTGGQQPRPGGKLSTSYRLSPLALLIVERLAEREGVSGSAIVESALRRAAEAAGYSLEELRSGPATPPAPEPEGEK